MTFALNGYSSIFLIGEKLPEKGAESLPQLFLWLPPTTERGWVRVASCESLVGVAWAESEEDEGAGLGAGEELGAEILIFDSWRKKIKR